MGDMAAVSLGGAVGLLRVLRAFSASRRGCRWCVCQPGRVRVLVVEDDTRLADAIARGLGAEGFDADVVHDGREGLWRAQQHRYAAVVLDIMLPGFNGYEVCRQLRKTDAWTPILMLTAKDGEWDEVEALDFGADDYLTKPFSFAVLVARLRALTRRGAVPRPMVMEVGDLQVDLAEREVRRAGEPVALTPRERALIEALARRPGEAVSKLELLDEVWGLDTDTDPNVVEVYIGYLRRKLDAPFGANSIVTVRGAGYRLVDDRSLRAPPAARDEPSAPEAHR